MATAAHQGLSAEEFRRFGSHVRMEGLYLFQHQAVFPAPTSFSTLELERVLQKAYYLSSNGAVYSSSLISTQFFFCSSSLPYCSFPR